MAIINYFVSDVEKYKELRESKSWVFTNIEKQHDEQFISPCGKYKLDIYTYSTGNGNWNYTEGIVTKLSNNKEIVSIKRNYASFYHLFFDKYFIAGEDYQGYSVINLETETCNVYFPDEAYKGYGFCLACVYGVINNKLIVEGCYWGNQYEVVIYDFTNPETLPLLELERFVVDGYVSIKDNILSIEQELEYRLSDSKFYKDLSDEEQLEIDKNPKLSAYKMITITKIIN